MVAEPWKQFRNESDSEMKTIQKWKGFRSESDSELKAIQKWKRFRTEKDSEVKAIQKWEGFRTEKARVLTKLAETSILSVWALNFEPAKMRPPKYERAKRWTSLKLNPPNIEPYQDLVRVMCWFRSKWDGMSKTN